MELSNVSFGESIVRQQPPFRAAATVIELTAYVPDADTVAAATRWRSMATSTSTPTGTGPVGQDADPDND